MARRRRSVTNRKSMSTGRARAAAFDPAGLKAGRTDGRNSSSAGGFTTRRKANNNTAAYTGYNAAAFGLKTTTGAASVTGKGNNPGASDNRRKANKNTTYKQNTSSGN